VTDWYLKDGELIVLVGKNGYESQQLKEDIANYKKAQSI